MNAKMVPKGISMVADLITVGTFVSPAYTSWAALTGRLPHLDPSSPLSERRIFAITLAITCMLWMFFFFLQLRIWIAYWKKHFAKQQGLSYLVSLACGLFGLLFFISVEVMNLDALGSPALWPWLVPSIFLWVSAAFFTILSVELEEPRA